ncbi:MAG: type VI secretion system Vgr family protein [Sandaracinaceae bacterium]
MVSAPLTMRAECGLGADLVVEQFSLEERLDEPYLATCALRLDHVDPDPSLVLGGDVAIDVTRDGFERRVVGIARATSTLRETAHVEESGALRVEVVPALWMLSLRRDTRMFQEKSVPEILETVLTEGLGPYGRAVRLELNADYAPREYCLQYQETDLDFVHRLLREEGISYAFDHAGAVEEMVLRDANTSYVRAAGAESPLPLSTDRRAALGTEALVRFERVLQRTVTKVTLREHDFTAPQSPQEGETGDADNLGVTRESYEHGWGRSVSLFDYSPNRYGANDIATLKDTRLEEHASLALTGRGLGRVLGFTAGMTFEVSGHPTVGVDGEYLLTAVQHLDTALDGSPEPYHNRFECIPLDVPWRPQRDLNPPAITSVQTGVVTGPAGEEIHTDEYGRVKVQFHWDRENAADETSSCWVRVQQKWAGDGWGFWWLPRIGMEVVVQFIDGDPDRPLVTGSVYNGTNGTPYTLPGDKTKSTIKSNSSPGGGGFNELRFEDLAGEEEIFTHAQKDYNEVVENDHTTLVHHDQRNEVDNDQTQTVHNNQTERVDVDQDLSVGANRSLHIEGDFDETVDGTETRHVVGDVAETFGANETRSVGGNLTETFEASETRTLGTSQTETVTGNRAITIEGDSGVNIGADLTQTVVGGITIKTPANWDVTATGGYTAILPGGFNLVSAGGYSIGAPGGVVQIDSIRSILAGTIKTDGAFARSICGMKTEAFGINILNIGSGHGVAMIEGFVGITVNMSGSVLKTMGAKIKAGAMRLRSGPEVS